MSAKNGLKELFNLLYKSVAPERFVSLYIKESILLHLTNACSSSNSESTERCEESFKDKEVKDVLPITFDSEDCLPSNLNEISDTLQRQVQEISKLAEQLLEEQHEHMKLVSPVSELLGNYLISENLQKQMSNTVLNFFESDVEKQGLLPTTTSNTKTNKITSTTKTRTDISKTSMDALSKNSKTTRFADDVDEQMSHISSTKQSRDTSRPLSRETYRPILSKSSMWSPINPQECFPGSNQSIYPINSNTIPTTTAANILSLEKTWQPHEVMTSSGACDVTSNKKLAVQFKANEIVCLDTENSTVLKPDKTCISTFQTNNKLNELNQIQLTNSSADRANAATKEDGNSLSKEIQMLISFIGENLPYLKQSLVNAEPDYDVEKTNKFLAMLNSNMDKKSLTPTSLKHYEQFNISHTVEDDDDENNTVSETEEIAEGASQVFVLCDNHYTANVLHDSDCIICHCSTLFESEILNLYENNPNLTLHKIEQLEQTVQSALFHH